MIDFWLINQSGAGLWWSLWVPSSSGYSMIGGTKTKWGSQRAFPEGSLGKECSLLTPFPGVCYGGCEDTVSALFVLSVPMNRSSAGHTGCSRPPGAPAITSLLCHWKVLSGLGCAAVPGCILSKSMSCLCQDAKLFMALMHWAVPSCSWKYSVVKYTPSQKRSQ